MRSQHVGRLCTDTPLLMCVCVVYVIMCVCSPQIAHSWYSACVSTPYQTRRCEPSDSTELQCAGVRGMDGFCCQESHHDRSDVSSSQFSSQNTISSLFIQELNHVQWTSLIRHSMGPDNNVGLGGCWIMECLLPYLWMVTVPHIMVELERMLDYKGVGLVRFRCTRRVPSTQPGNTMCIRGQRYKHTHESTHLLGELRCLDFHESSLNCFEKTLSTTKCNTAWPCHKRRWVWVSEWVSVCACVHVCVCVCVRVCVCVCVCVCLCVYTSSIWRCYR